MLQEASISSELTGRTIIAVALDYVNLKTAIFITVSVITLCAAILFLYLLKNPALTAQDSININRFNVNSPNESIKAKAT